MWREGKWYNEGVPFLIFFAEDQKVIVKSIICLDYPEVDPSPWIQDLTWTFGDFGSCRKEIFDATGVENYNFQSKTKETTFLLFCDSVYFDFTM